jgi:molecular chaperone DnaK
VCELGNRASVIPSVILVREDEEVLIGEAAERRAVTEPERVAREFKRRLGDPTPLLLGGRPYSAEQLQSRVLRSVIAQVAEREGGPPGRVAVTRPANWGPYKLDLFEQALGLARVEDAVVLSEPEAAAIHYASQERLEPGAQVAVYDLGGGTFDAAVLRKSGSGFELLGRPQGIERLGGIDFDEAVFAHVVRALGGALDELDLGDPAAAAALARLRKDCVDAKESLSADTEVSIPIVLPNVQTEVRLTRAEFESLIRPPLTDSIEVLRVALRSAGLEAEDLSAVLLVGGSSRIPLVAQLVTAELGRPVAVDAHPKHGIAMGAALAAAAARASVAPPVPETVPVALPTPVPEVATGGAATPEPAAVPTPDPASIAVSPPRQEPAAFEPSVAPRGGKRIGAFVAAAVAVLALAGVAVAAIGGGGDDPELAVGDVEEPEAEAPDPAPEPEPDPDPVPDPELDLEPAPEPVATDPTPPGIAGDVPFVVLDEIRVEDGRYVVDYTPFRFDPLIDSDPATRHLHFFWDIWDPWTVGTQEPQATRGRWLIYDRAPDGSLRMSDDFFQVSAAPTGAGAVCAIVADHQHRVIAWEQAEVLASCLELPRG